MIVTNHSDRAFPLPNRVWIEAGASIPIRPGIWEAVRHNERVRRALAGGRLSTNEKQARADPLDHDGDGLPGGSMPAEPVEMSAAGLVAAADTLGWHTFKAAAKRILGDGCPTRKEDILVALADLAGELNDGL